MTKWLCDGCQPKRRGCENAPCPSCCGFLPGPKIPASVK